MQYLFQELLFLHPLSLLSLLLFLTFIYTWMSQNSKLTKRNTPPSPPRLPIIGNLHQLAGTHPHHTLRALSQKYGDLMFLRLGSKPTIVVSSAEVASQVLKTHDRVFAGRPNLRVLRRVLGNGKDVLCSSYGEYWKQLRTICAVQLLSVRRVRSFRKVREEEMDLLSNKIRGLSMVNLSEIFMSMSTDFISRVAFGKKHRGEKGGGLNFNKLFSEMSKLMGDQYIGDFVTWLGWIDRISGVDHKVSKVVSQVDEFLQGILVEHSNRISEKEGDELEDGMRDLVDVLLEAQREVGSGSFYLDNESIKALILDIFVGGSDTTYISLEWIMSELIRNPRVMKELQKEVRGIVGDKKTVSEDELENMKYLKLVIKEALRLHPPAPLLPPHESTEDVKINGYDIGAGTMVMVNLWAISRDPRYWEEPESFYPERFLNSPIDFKGQDFQFLPFGAGRRACPGMVFAMVTTEFVIANLVHQFDWELPNGANGESLEMMEASGLTVHKQNPLIVIATPRIG